MKHISANKWIQELQHCVNLLYPPRCPICDGPLRADRETADPALDLVCEGCRAKLTTIHSPYCMHCGKQLEEDETEYCYDCKKKGQTDFLRRGLAAFPYSEVMKPSMYAFKSGRREYAAFYAREIDALYHDAILSWGAEALIPVPLHPAKLRKRGYNQAEDLARELSKLTGIPVRNDIVTKVRNTLPQKTLSEKDRKNNAKNAFKLVQSILEYRKIILVDDIYTTGMTLNECARPFVEAGVKEIFFLTVCIGRGF